MKLLYVTLLISILVGCTATIIEYPQVNERSHELYELSNIMHFTYGAQMQQVLGGTSMTTSEFRVEHRANGYVVTSSNSLRGGSQTITSIDDNYLCVEVGRLRGNEQVEESCQNQMLFPEEFAFSHHELLETAFGSFETDVYTAQVRTYYVVETIPVPVRIVERNDIATITYVLITYS